MAWYRQLTDGYRLIMAGSMLRNLWWISVVVGLLFSAATATIVLYLLNRLGLPEAWYG